VQEDVEGIDVKCSESGRWDIMWSSYKVVVLFIYLADHYSGMTYYYIIAPLDQLLLVLRLPSSPTVYPSSSLTRRIRR